jgi:uncharacterized protein (TIGR00288 family)
MEKQRCDAGEADPLRSFTHPPLFPSFALLIDADNTSVELFPTMMKQVETWGSVTLRRVYGNQETLLSQKWKELCLLYALQPMVHIGISGVKNATDIALTVDAMDLLHTQSIRRFCLVTGDQDFTALVLRLRSYGCQVYCIGKPSKADALAKVCTDFVPVELPSSPPAKKSPLDSTLTLLLTQAMEELIQEKQLEWVPVPHLGSRLKRLDGTYTAKAYGYKSTPALCQARTDLFETRPGGSHLEVRLRQETASQAVGTLSQEEQEMPSISVDPAASSGGSLDGQTSEL